MTDSETTSTEAILRLHTDDLVGIARRALKAGESLTVNGNELTVVTDIPSGHKIALGAFAKGDLERPAIDVTGGVDVAGVSLRVGARTPA